MPLKISDSSPTSISVLNKWADNIEQKSAAHTALTQQHAAALKTLTDEIALLKKKVG